MATAKPLTPNFLWAQDKNNIFVKIDLADVADKDLKVQVTREGLSFGATSRGKKYELEIKFRFPVNPKTVQYSIKRIKIDWEKFIDEDNSDKKELDMNNNEDWKNLKPRPTPKEWDEPSEYDDIYVFPDKEKEKEKENENENKKEETNVTPNESNKEQEASTITTENEKSQPQQISEEK
ncbi:hypothetical protein RFI_39962 [Reticulomyxa filosa]|uniref:CS domain-containing protein n=1 Tax=Reticulomyxa filosa TaxID=46433 RepID=X6L772_RETFI|nr:hypothetical protein RFI_39962 [Reticulomyxa filosa]|eukprot:ETN97567.1 hypothetical protein RFI_39962 [Reticulomyxa filosa]